MASSLPRREDGLPAYPQTLSDYPAGYQSNQIVGHGLQRSVVREIDQYRNEPKWGYQEPVATVAPLSVAEDKCAPGKIQQKEPSNDRKDTGKPDERLSCERNDPMLVRYRPTGRSGSHINDRTNRVEDKQGQAHSLRQKAPERHSSFSVMALDSA